MRLPFGTFCLVSLLTTIFSGCGARQDSIARDSWTAMGTLASLSYRPDTLAHTSFRRTDAQRYVRDTFATLEILLSAWNPDSELSRLSRAGCTNYLDAVSPCVRPCYVAAFALKEQSGGAFDPYIGKRLRELGVGGGTYADLDLGAIAKGFAVDQAATALASCPGSMLLDLGGNLRAVGPGSWRTGIRNPFAGNQIVALFDLGSGESTATSGNYERFIERDGVRYSHILDGRTGAFTHGIAGVTVITPPEYGALLGDGLSTTLFILGPREGSTLLNRHYPHAGAIWIPDTPDAPRLIVTANVTARLKGTVWPLEVLR